MQLDKLSQVIRALAVFSALILLHAPPVRADEVHLSNGDRLTGRAVSLANGTLTFATSYGEVRISWEEVTALAVEEEILVTLAGTPLALVTITMTEAPAQAMLQPGGTVALADILVLARPELNIDGGANVGFITTAGNTDVNSLRVDGDIVARSTAHRYTASAAITRTHDGGAETARNWTMGVKYDRFLTTRFFINANTILTNDRFRDLNLRTAAGAGIGYQVLDTARTRLTADAGFGYVSERLEAQADTSYGAARESAALTLFLIPSRMEFFHEHDGYFGITGDNNLFVRMQNGVRIGLAGGFVTTLRHDFDYDRSPAPGRRTTDQTLALTLGYRF